MITIFKKIKVRSYLVIIFVVFLSGFSQSNFLSNTDKIQIINDKIQMVEDSLTDNASEIESVSRYVKSFEKPFSISPSPYKPDDEIFLIFPKNERDTFELELAKTVFTEVKSLTDFKELIYISSEYILDDTNKVIGESSVIVCKKEINVCAKIHKETIERGITSVLRNYDDTWKIVGFYNLY